MCSAGLPPADWPPPPPPARRTAARYLGGSTAGIVGQQIVRGDFFSKTCRRTFATQYISPDPLINDERVVTHVVCERARDMITNYRLQVITGAAYCHRTPSEIVEKRRLATRKNRVRENLPLL